MMMTDNNASDSTPNNNDTYIENVVINILNILMIVEIVELLGGRPLCAGYLRSTGSRGEFCVDRVARDCCHIPYCVVLNDDDDGNNSTTDENSTPGLVAGNSAEDDNDAPDNNNRNIIDNIHIVVSETFANKKFHKIQKFYGGRSHLLSLVVSCSAVAKVVHGVEYASRFVIPTPARLFPNSSGDDDDMRNAIVRTAGASRHRQDEDRRHIRLPIIQCSDLFFHPTIEPCLQRATSISFEDVPGMGHDDIYLLPAFFLHGYTNLRELTFCRLEHVSTTPMAYLHDTKKLRRLSLENFPNAVEVDDLFLSGCASLESLDLTPLRHVTTIGMAFLQGCSSLTTLDLSPLTSVVEIGRFFLGSCSGLVYLDLQPILTSLAPPVPPPPAIPSTTTTSLSTSSDDSVATSPSFSSPPQGPTYTIPNDFLAGCTSLATIDLTPMATIVTIGDGFMSGCASIVVVNVSPLVCLKEVGSRLMKECVSLRHVDMRPLEERGVLINPSGLFEGCPHMV